jgi:uncharacterized protein
MKPLIPFGWLRVIVLIASIFLLAILLVKLTDWAAAVAGIGSMDGASPPDSLLARAIISFVAVAGPVVVFWKIIDRRPWQDLGMQWQKLPVTGAAGLFAAIAMLCAGSLLLLVAGNLTFYEPEIDAATLLKSALAMGLIAVAEELLFRAYILKNLKERFPLWASLAISSIIFALAHVQNPASGIVPMLVILSAGLLMGIGYVYTGSLWFCIFLHFAWNFLQGPVLGYKVSGLEMESVFSQNLQGPEWLTGGSFGFEGSVLALLLNLGFFSYLWLKYRKSRPGISHTMA